MSERPESLGRLTSKNPNMIMHGPNSFWEERCESLMLATIRNYTWNMLNMHQITKIRIRQNEIIHTSVMVALEKD